MHVSRLLPPPASAQLLVPSYRLSPYSGDFSILGHYNPSPVLEYCDIIPGLDNLGRGFGNLASLQIGSSKQVLSYQLAAAATTADANAITSSATLNPVFSPTHQPPPTSTPSRRPPLGLLRSPISTIHTFPTAPFTAPGSSHTPDPPSPVSNQ